MTNPAAMKTSIALLPFLFALVLSPRLCLAQAFTRGQVLFQSDFESPATLAAWHPAPTLADGFNSKQSLLVQLPPNSSQPSAIVLATLPVENMRGCTLYCSAMIRAQAVTDKPKPWHGIKFMVPIDAPSGKSWPQAALDTGSFDWKHLSFAVRIPSDATAVSLCLGLEAVTGKVWFDDIKITIAKAPAIPRTRPTTGPVYKGHSLPRLRGTMINPAITPDSLRVLGQQWNANLLRWQLIRFARPGQTISPADYDKWLDSELARLDAAIPLCQQYGIHVVIDLHSPPGGKPTVSGYVGSDDRLFTDKSCQDHFVNVWRKIATRYKDTKIIWAYDLANEPVEDVIPDDCDDWQALAQHAALAIRAIDPLRTIIVEPADWGGPQGLRDFYPIHVPNVVYSVHMYLPMEFTHQGVFGNSAPVRYPGPINGQHWDKARIEAALKPVIDFQKSYNVHIYIGEFSAIRWAPDNSAHRYLTDVIDIFESHNWDWTYHAFREWQGWSVEHGQDRADTKPTTPPTDRQKLLQAWFAQNQKKTP
ncbi:MAG: cellulase family glycosylhydrolase [Planctomycetota bacterium]|nr:cellulase family glycosylhydrolase [Planctomycetota bacterium]